MDTELFSKYFNNCPILDMEGKCYPVDILYGHTTSNLRVDESVRSAIRMHIHEDSGDILVFQTGSEECELAVSLCYKKLDELQKMNKPVASCLIYALYGSQSNEDQAQVFEMAPEDTRKIIFSTNIAETSLTIDGIGFVIDCGYVKQKQYNPRSGMDCQVTVPISKVQAIQRAGRAGRTQSGKCYRMYSEKVFKEQMENITVPEILRVNLTSLILTLKCIGIDDVQNFDYVQKPQDDLIIQALRQLYMLDALDGYGKLTSFGRELCKYPLEPTYSKSLMMAKYLKCQDELLIIVSMLSTENIYKRVSKTHTYQHEMQLEAMKRNSCQEGDHYTYQNIFNSWENSNFSDIWAKRNYINVRAQKQSRKIREQIKGLAKVINYDTVKEFLKDDPIYKLFREMKEPIDSLSKYKRIAMALSSAFFVNSARRVHNSNEDYLQFSEGTMVNVDINSTFYIINKFPEYVIFTEQSGHSIVRGCMRILSKVENEWIEPYLKKVKNVNMDAIVIGKDRDKEKGGEGVLALGKRKRSSEGNRVWKVEGRDESKDEKKEKVISDAKERFLVRMKNSKIEDNGKSKKLKR